jgi:hypothetical protein
MPPLPLRKRLLFSLILLGVVWLLAELACLGGLWALQRFKGIGYRPAEIRTLSARHRRILAEQLLPGHSPMAFDPLLGWIPRPDTRTRKFRTNRDSLRAYREYPPVPPAGVTRLAAFGDSFTFGDESNYAATWERFLEGLDPRLEVLNFGIPGGDPGQAFLRYRRDGGRFHPHAVLIGFMSENIHRMVNTFRPFYQPETGIPLGKPRFLLRGGRLELAENPIRSLAGYRELLRDERGVLPRLGRHDFFYQTSRPRRFDALPSVRLVSIFAERSLGEPILRGGVYNTRSEAYQVTRAVLEAFAAQVEKDGAVPVFLLFPDYGDLVTRHAGGTVSYAPLRADLERGRFPVLDLADGFARHDPDGGLLVHKFAHYRSGGNRIVARTLRDFLAARGLARRPQAR